MHIGIDGGPLSISDERLKVGVYRDTLELIVGMSKLRENYQFTVYVFTPISSEVGERLGKNVTVRLLQPSTGFMKVRLPFELAVRPVDAFIGTAQAVPVAKCPIIGIINDLGFLYNPDAYGDSAKKLEIQTKQLVNRTSHIICISECTKADVLSHYPIDSNKITICYPGVSAVFSSSGPSFQHLRPYVLFVGSLTRSKNIPQAFKIFSQFLKIANKHVDFLLAGGDYWPDSEIADTIGALGLSDKVTLLGRVSDGQLANLYRGATVFLTTALREGFCLPVAEAMASGTPVVALDRGALKEIVGQGGFVVKTDKQAVDALLNLFTAGSFRIKYKKQAIARAKMFTTDGFAGKVLEVVETQIRKV